MLQSVLTYLKNDGVLSSWKYIIINALTFFGYAVLGFSEPGSWWLGICVTLMWMHIFVIGIANFSYIAIIVKSEMVIENLRKKGTMEKFVTNLMKTRSMMILGNIFVVLMIFKSGHSVAGSIYIINFSLILLLVFVMRGIINEAAMNRLKGV